MCTLQLTTARGGFFTHMLQKRIFERKQLKMSSDEESISGKEATSEEEEVVQVPKKKRKAKKKVRSV